MSVSLRTLRSLSVVGLGLLALSVLAACGGGGGNEAASPTSTLEAAPTLRAGLQEVGEAPIYWRTEDAFQSIQVDDLYKVVLRITSGYDEEALSVVAARGDGGDVEDVEFEAGRVVPEGEDAPGEYYVFLLKLPKPGNWQVTVIAGEDEASITVQVKPAESSARD